jgi:hypothetical protein
MLLPPKLMSLPAKEIRPRTARPVECERNGTVRAGDMLTVEGLPGDWSRAIYPYGLLCGFLMSVSEYPMRSWDAPIPMIVVGLFFPYHIGVGFLAARRGGVESAMVTGALTALTGHVVLFLATALYAFVNNPWPAALIWLGMGVSLVLLTLFLGAVGGVAGGAIAKALKSVRPQPPGDPAARF